MFMSQHAVERKKENANCNACVRKNMLMIYQPQYTEC